MEARTFSLHSCRPCGACSTTPTSRTSTLDRCYSHFLPRRRFLVHHFGFRPHSIFQDTSCKSWIIQRQASSFGNCGVLPNPGFQTRVEDIASMLRAFYRFLLIGAVGLSFSARPVPAIAAPVSSETVVENIMGKNMEKGNEKGNIHQERVIEPEKPEGFQELDEQFWRGIELIEDSVKTTLKDYLEVHPTNVPAFGFLAQMLLGKDDIENALKVLDKVEQLDPSDMEWKFMKARAYSITNQLQLARKAYEDILVVEPFSTRVLQRLAMVLYRMDKSKSTGMELMNTSLSKAIEENRHDEAQELKIVIGQFLTFKGKFQEALQLYKDMMQENSDDFRVYLCEGIVYSVLGEVDKAEEVFKMYEELCPRDYPTRDVLDGYVARSRREGRKLADLKTKEGKDGKGAHKPKKWWEFK